MTRSLFFKQVGDTALMVACRLGHMDTVQLLLDRGSDVTAKDKVVILYILVIVLMLFWLKYAHGRVVDP